jgi:hypothetical protein
MQRLLSLVTAASLAVAGITIGGCQHDKNTSSSSGTYPADSARTSSGGAYYDATGGGYGNYGGVGEGSGIDSTGRPTGNSSGSSSGSGAASGSSAGSSSSGR